MSETPKLCAHLQPLAEYLRTHGIEVTPCASSPWPSLPYVWWSCPCVIDDVPALRERLGLDPALHYEAYFGFAMGAWTSWICREHDIAWIGPYPGKESDDTPHVK